MLGNIKKLSEQLFKLAGGKENIISVDNCFTRLRLEVKNLDNVDVVEIKKAGAKEVLISGEDYIQIVLGPKVKEVAAYFREQLN